MSRKNKNANAAIVVAMQTPEIAPTTPVVEQQATTTEVITPKVITVVQTRKIPAKLSKSMLISILDRAGFSVKQIVACSEELLNNKVIPDAFKESHVRNSIADFRANAYKAHNADLVAQSLNFMLPTKHEIVTLTSKQQFELQQAALNAKSTTVNEQATSAAAEEKPAN